MNKKLSMTAPDRWGQRMVLLSSGIPVRRVPAALARRFFQICANVAGAVAAEKNLTNLQLAVLTHLYDEVDIDQNGLAARLGIDRSNTSLIVDELEAKGLVKRRVNGVDRRSRLLQLTTRGKKIRDYLRPKAGVAQARILASLSPTEREVFLDLLVRVIDANEAYARPGATRRKPRYRQESSKPAREMP
jgi:DNA-binding MarR family transcriptional regulator